MKINKVTLFPKGALSLSRYAVKDYFWFIIKLHTKIYMLINHPIPKMLCSVG